MALVGRAKYTRTRAKFRGDATRGERPKFLFTVPLLVSHLFARGDFGARECISPESPTLETICSLMIASLKAKLHTRRLAVCGQR